MKNIKWIVLICLFAYAQVQAASFDCAKARTSLEKQICNANELSNLDAQVGEAFSTAKQDASTLEAKRLTQEQLQWLRNIRNRCTDAVCLLNAYKSRLNELDPFADKQLSCEEMRKFPGWIFSGGIDLGSGSGSPIEVDYRCPESLSQQKFMQKLLCSLAVAIPAYLASLFGLYQFRPWAPRVAIVGTALMLVVFPLLGAQTLSGVAQSLSFLASYLWGAVLVLACTSPCNAWFVAHIGAGAVEDDA